MDDCCSGKAEALEHLRARQSKVLKILLAANALMFVLEAGLGIVARSTALLGDSLDMLGDALVYAATLHVLGLGMRSKAKAVLLKGGMLAFFGILVLADAGQKIVTGAAPHAEIIGWVGLLALAVNVGCLLLLMRHRDQDINMKSAWVCSRNDIISNVAVIAAGFAVGYFHSPWPDTVVGIGIAGLFLASAVGIVKDGLQGLRQQAAQS